MTKEGGQNVLTGPPPPQLRRGSSVVVRLDPWCRKEAGRRGVIPSAGEWLSGSYGARTMVVT